MIIKENFTRINNDVNGNPRYVIHMLDCITDKEREHPFTYYALDRTKRLYSIALQRVKKSIGGKKYNTKNYPHHIVIQSYNLDYEVNALNKALDESGQTTEQTK